MLRLKMLKKLSRVLLISLLILLGAQRPAGVRAGIDTWTSIGPEGGKISALAIKSMTPATLYAGYERIISYTLPVYCRNVTVAAIER